MTLTIHHRAKYLYFSIVLLSLTGCNKPETHTYSVQDGITYVVTLKELKRKSEHKSAFLYFDLTIKNESSKRIFFDPGAMRASLNGVMSEFVYYDSLASVETRKAELVKGVTNYHLYFVFKETVGKEISSFVPSDFGLSE